MKQLTLVLLCLWAIPALASDEWFCTTQASKIEGQAVKACGVGQGHDENEARLKAFDAAKEEFLRLCSTSDQCRNRETAVNPERTSCSKDGEGFKCYRMVSFELKGEAKADKPNAVTQVMKVRKGMSKTDLLAAIGKPDSVQAKPEYISGPEWKQYLYRGAMCQYGVSKSCSVTIQNDRVTSYDGIKLELTDDL